ncbi:MAG: hypothetical protein U0V74_02405 [Chitinophagales bacterium]
MKVQSKLNVSYTDILALLQAQFPQYQIELLKNPLFRFEYIQVRKSAMHGAWIRVKDGTNITVDGAIPSTLLRGLAGGLLLYAIAWSGMKKMEKEMGNFLQEKLAS